MKAKNGTPKDRELLYKAYKYSQLGGMRAIGDKLSEAKQERFLNLGLLKIERSYEGWDGNMYPIYGLSASGLAAIQPLIDKAAADKLAREAADKQSKIKRWEKEYKIKFELDKLGISFSQLIVGSGNGMLVDVSFHLAMAVRYSHKRECYEPVIYKHDDYWQNPLDVDALIREAQDARTVAGILNGMLEQPEPESQSDIPAWIRSLPTPQLDPELAPERDDLAYPSPVSKREGEQS